MINFEFRAASLETARSVIAGLISNICEAQISAEVEKVQTGHQRRFHPVPVADQAGCPPQINLDVHRRSRLDEQCQMNRLEELEVSMITGN